MSGEAFRPRRRRLSVRERIVRRSHPTSIHGGEESSSAPTYRFDAPTFAQEANEVADSATRVEMGKFVEEPLSPEDASLVVAVCAAAASN